MFCTPGYGDACLPGSADAGAYLTASIYHARATVGQVTDFVTHLHRASHILATCQQADLDEFFAATPSTSSHIRSFLTWAQRRRHLPVSLQLPSSRLGALAAPADAEQRWSIARQLVQWMLTRTHRYLATVMAQTRDPDGFTRLDQLAQAGHGGSRLDARIAATRTAIILACKGDTIAQITVGDCVELVDTQRRVHVRGGQKKVNFYLRLHALGIFPDDAPHTIRAFGLAAGRLTIEELVDRYPLQSKSIRT